MPEEIIRVCVDQPLDTEEERIKAMEIAVEENPANLLVPGHTFPPDQPPGPAELSLVVAKKWKPGRTLRVRFVDGDTNAKHCLMLAEPSVHLEFEAACPLAVLPNADAVGYYRWSLSEDRWRELLGQLDHLTPGERCAVIDNLAADFEAGRYDVLLGTQMVAKGHDFPRVTLVGVLSAD